MERRSKDELYATVRWEMDLNKGVDGGGRMSETVWMCDQMRAGQVYARRVFDTLAEAETFQRRMLEAEPDAMFDVKQIEARQVWN